MKLIINSDDFGLSQSITDGIVEGIKEGIITSTSIMANMPYAKYAVEQALKHNIKCVGLHCNLTVGKPLIHNPNLVDAGGVFLYNRKQIENPSLTYQDVYNEIMAQIKKVEELSNGKLKIDHIDVHHHLEDNEYIKFAVHDIAKELNLPVRKLSYAIGLKCPDVYYHNFTIENVKIEELQKMIKKYKNTNLTIELLTHSGYVDDYTKTVTSYVERDKELKILKQAKEIGLFNDIELICFKDLQ